jgi:hypothetical protein
VAEPSKSEDRERQLSRLHTRDTDGPERYLGSDAQHGFGKGRLSEIYCAEMVISP